MVRERLTSSHQRSSLMTPCRMVLFCCTTWLLAFIVISSTIFDTPKFDSGQFGYNMDVGICNELAPGASRKEHSLSGFTFSVGFLVPCVLINISYITIFCIIKHRSKQTTTILGNNSKCLSMRKVFNVKIYLLNPKY